ncbi:hypothetical protein BDA96_03G020200 [Sorghum bicolor]|uniref:Embryo surrounding factor 1 brassicaceae domain-containing protein n=2 Tax=Sorghum bicolor TaxID=4558 RepID=A0A921UNJ3_SORBI|nr:uncharacterized protein LOC110433468 [Sorghum bicolor]KAG0535931.1 hypothetical protein BDA96_03G020200 [Sorghum bicolor]KXG31576.1 hypothetical protein SORBI_3003G020800 [Sorghum bicolor]|eukprot:XP_021311330.1 uncharacterized protein LOC110433468 [Sorghum bicolor]
MKRNNGMMATMFLGAILFGSLAMQAQCRPHELLDARRRSVDTIANNSTSPLDVEKKNDELLMVCLEYKCDKFQPNGTCFCCEVNFTNGCFLTHHECVANCRYCKGPNCT